MSTHGQVHNQDGYYTTPTKLSVVPVEEDSAVGPSIFLGDIEQSGAKVACRVATTSADVGAKVHRHNVLFPKSGTTICFEHQTLGDTVVIGKNAIYPVTE